jgi:hypothetical protein
LKANGFKALLTRRKYNMSELSALDDSIIQSQMVGQQPQQQMPSTHGLYVEFYMHPEQNMEESNKQNRPIFEELPYVMIMVPGDKSTVIRRPVRTGVHPNCDNNRFHNEYVAFLQKEEQPIQGTLLSEWPQITRATCMELEALNVRTVDHLADMPDSLASQYMGMQDLKQKASKWLELTKAEAPMQQLQAELEARDSVIAAQGNAIEDMQEELRKLNKAKTPKKKGAAEE